MKLKLILIIICIFSQNIYSVLTTSKKTLADVYLEYLTNAIQSNDKEGIEEILNYNISSFENFYCLNESYYNTNMHKIVCQLPYWSSSDSFTEQDLNKLKNSSFNILIDVQKVKERDINELEDILVLFLEHGLDINFKDPLKNYQTPLIYAIENEDDVLTELLIKYGANINQGNIETPLNKAIERNRANVVALLLNLGANLDYLSQYLLENNNASKSAYLEYLQEKKKKF